MNAFDIDDLECCVAPAGSITATHIVIWEIIVAIGIALA